MEHITRVLLNLILFCLLILTSSCEEEVVVEIRDPYIGTYEFTIVEKTWLMSFPYEYDTSHFIGTIEKYKTVDSEIDVFFGNDSEERERDINKITIHFLDELYLTTEINETGLFTSRESYFVFQVGEFIGTDSVQFTYGGRSGTLGGWQSYVSGKKID